MSMSLKKNYTSPRWSGEICDCSMPMTFDTYSSCSFNCLYCFAFFQKSHNVLGYKDHLNVSDRVTRGVNPDKVRKLFIHSLNNTAQNNTEKQFQRYIQNKITMQWGGLADGFDDNEKKYGLSLDLLKFFDKIDYPLSISTKGVFFTKDKRYMDLIKKHAHNWHFKISIITYNSRKSALIEEGVPSPKERLFAIKRLASNGINVTLRLRPYIIGISEDYPQLIKKAKKAGANSVTTEFFCLETRADENLKKKYKQISQIVGYDIWDFYKKNSVGNGYKRLNYNIKAPIIKNMKKIAHNNKMMFYVSDAHHKEKSDATCCCGCPPSFKIYRGHFNEALQIAKRNPAHVVYWRDISKEALLLKSVSWQHAVGFNTTSTRERSKRNKQTFYDYLKSIWNTPKNNKSPYKYFGGVLYPIGLDTEHNVIYKYNIKKAK